MIGIIGAMEQEVSELREEMTDSRVIVAAGISFYSGKLRGKDIVIAMCGIGKVNAAVASQVMIDRFSCDRIINTGVAGSLDAGIDIGDIVLSTDALQHDMDVSALGYAPGVIPDQDTSIFVADQAMLTIAEEACRKVNPDISVYRGRVLSGDQFISDGDKKDRLVRDFAGKCTEMEGAAIAQTCWMNGVPFLIVRSISDKADGSATMDYPAFQKKAIEHTVRLLLEMAERL